MQIKTEEKKTALKFLVTEEQFKGTVKQSHEGILKSQN